jgi:Predicted methyltransferases
MFLGILPRKESERKKVFENNIKNDATLVFFESQKEK